MNSALLWILLSLGHQAICAPVLQNEAAVDSSYTTSNGSLQDELRSILLTGILSKASNNCTIQKSFVSGIRRICIPITLSITCTDQTACTPGETDHNCSSGLDSTFVWTDFDSSRLPGKVLFYFASMDATMPAMPGFGWSESCHLDYQYNADSNNYTLSTESVPILDVTVTTLPCMSAHGSDLFDALEYLITMMPSYAEQKESNTATIIERQRGCAQDISDLEADYNNIRDEYGKYAAIILILFVFGVVGTLYFHIEELIRVTQHGKPKLYFHFWSVILAVFGGFIYIVQATPLLENFALFTAAICLIIVALLFPVAIMCIDAQTSRRKVVITKLFTSPLISLVPTILGKFIWQCVATSFGLYFSNVLICYLIYVMPNVILVYYFYPLRTLIRALYVMGAAFYTVVLGAFTLYQFERAIETLKLFCCMSCNRRARWNGTLSRPFTARTELDENYHKSYYLKEFRDTVRKYGGLCTVLMMPLNILKFILSLFVLVVLVQAELILGALLFEKTTITEANVNSLLAILPTIILFVATWLSRGIFFDLTADSRELYSLFSRRGPATRGGVPMKDMVVTTSAHGNRSDEEEEDTGGDGTVLDYSNFWSWTTREVGGETKGGLKPRRKPADDGIERTETVNREEHDEIQPKSTINMDDSVGDTSSAVLDVIVEGAGGSAADEREAVSEDSSDGTTGDAGGLGCLCRGACPGPKQADSAGEEDAKQRSRLHKRKTPSASGGMYGALHGAGNVFNAVGGVAGGIGGMASGIGSVAGAVGGDSDTAGKVSAVAGGFSKSFVGFGGIFKSFSASKIVSKPKKSSKSSSEAEEGAVDDKSSESGLGGLDAVGEVAKGMGGVVEGVGGVAGGIGGVAGAVGGSGDVAGKVSVVADGIGKSLGAFGEIAKGLGSASKGLRFGSKSKRTGESEALARGKESSNTKEGANEGTKEGEGGGGSGGNDETTPLLEMDTPQN